MIVKGINPCYYFKAEHTPKGVHVECGDMEGNLTALLISNEDWQKVRQWV